jgi:MFS transporter, YNFM family, putative membrane transport protein
VTSSAVTAFSEDLDIPRTKPAKQKSDLGPGKGAFAVFLCGAFAFLELYCTQPLLPLLSRYFHASEASVGVTVSASTLGAAAAAALLAMFGERLDRKRTIIVAMSALAGTVALTATAHSLAELAVWRFFQGLLTPGIFIIVIAYITEEWKPLQVPRVMSIYVAGTVFGGFVGRVSGGILAEHYGWRVMFVILGVCAAAGALLTNRILQPGTRKVGRVEHASILMPMLKNLRNPRLLATFGIGFCMLFALVSSFSYVTFYLASAPFYLSTSALSYLFSVYLVGLCATLGVGRILARLGLRHGMLGAITLCALGVLVTLIPSVAVVAVGLSIASAGVFIAQTCANSFLRDAAPGGARVSAAGLYICSYYIGGTVGGVLPGLFWKGAGWPGCVALTCALLLLVAAPLAFFGWRSRPAALDPVPL